jgi:membrane protease YdiL (CAAX protease family)
MDFSAAGDAKLSAWFKEPFFWGYVLLFAAAFLLSSGFTTGWVSGIYLFAGTMISSAILLYFTRKDILPDMDIPRPAVEGCLALGWFLAFFVASMVTHDSSIFGNEGAKWMWFVILPVSGIWLVGRSRRSLKDTLRSTGIRRQGIEKALLPGLLAFMMMSPAIFLSLSPTQTDKLQDLLNYPVKLAVMIPIGFVLMLATAGFTEEVFFRGILQARLSRWLGSDIRGCLLAAFLFGIYHLPYAFFDVSWPTHGNWMWAVTSVMTEQMVAGLLLGVLWMRTHNLGASVLCHALINTVAILASMSFG